MDWAKTTPRPDEKTFKVLGCGVPHIRGFMVMKMSERTLSISRVNHAGAGTGLFPVNKVNTRTAWRHQDVTWFIRRMFYKKCSGKSLKNSIENYIFIIITTYPGSNGLIWVSNECSLAKAPSSMNGCVVCCWGASWALFFPHNGIWSYFFQHNTGPFRLVDPASHHKTALQNNTPWCTANGTRGPFQYQGWF